MKRRMTVLILTLLLAASQVSAVGQTTGGTTSDPVITLSYINNKVIPDVKASVSSKAEAKWDSLYSSLSAKLGTIAPGQSTVTLTSAVNAYLAQKSAGYGFAKTNQTIHLKKGDTISVRPGSTLLIRSGTVTTSGINALFVNLTKGTEVRAGAAVASNQRYLSVGADATSGFTVSSATAVVLVSGAYLVTPSYSYVPKFTSMADALFSLGLFEGTPSGYNLQRSTTRLEALVMMVRVLGEKEEALAYTGSCPFADVPEWGQRYVAYAFSKGYTTGTSQNKFTPNSTVTADQYTTMLLRALGYTDSGAGADFQWNNSLTYAQKISFLTPTEVTSFRQRFLRDQMVFEAFYALTAPMKGSSNTLLARQVSKGRITQSQANAALSSVSWVRT